MEGEAHGPDHRREAACSCRSRPGSKDRTHVRLGDEASASPLKLTVGNNNARRGTPHSSQCESPEGFSRRAGIISRLLAALNLTFRA